MKIHPVLREIALLFLARNKEICLVGGAVRDMLRGKKAHDWDLASDATPDEVIGIFNAARPRGKVFPTGIKHGTVTVLFRGRTMEITTYRTEAGYTDGRRPDQVCFTASIEEDLSRRDFTINAIALRLPRGTKIDPFDGRSDLKKKIIRCVGDPARRFAEDGLRPLRAVRFAAQLSYTIEPHTLAAIPPSLDICALVSAERVKDELEKIVASDKPSRAFTLMEQTGLLRLFLPELTDCRGVDQKGFHRFDVLDHSLLACDYAASQQYPLDVRIAALLHDTGKVLTRSLDENGIWTFYQHETESEKIARIILSRLRFPNALIESVCHLVREHMFHYTDEWSDSAVRRFIVRVGEDYLIKTYQLRRADAYATAASEPEPGFLLSLMHRVEIAIAQKNAFSLRDLAVNGNDLIAIGVKPGKTLGIILNELLETVLDDPAQNTRDDLMRIAENLRDKLDKL